MIKQILLLLLGGMLFTSCASYLSIVNTDDNMKKVEIGMTKSEVVKIVGEHYEVASNNPEGTVWVYKTVSDNGFYFLYFERGKLREWTKEWFPVHRTEPLVPPLPPPTTAVPYQYNSSHESESPKK